MQRHMIVMWGTYDYWLFSNLMLKLLASYSVQIVTEFHNLILTLPTENPYDTLKTYGS